MDSEFGEEDAAPCAAGEVERVYGDGVLVVWAGGCAGGGFVSAGNVLR